MNRILLLLAVLALSAVVSGPLMAQSNPFVGSWKLDAAKSTFNGVAAPKSLSREVVAQDGGTKFSYKGVSGDGKTIDYSFSTNYDGKESPITGSGAPGGADAIVIKRIGSNKAEATFKKGGKDIGTSSSEVSKDGKVTTVKGAGKTADGKEFSTVSIYERQ